MLCASRKRESYCGWWFGCPTPTHFSDFYNELWSIKLVNLPCKAGSAWLKIRSSPWRYHFNIYRQVWLAIEKSRSLRNCFICHPDPLDWDVTSHNWRLLHLSGHFSAFHENWVGLEKFHQIYLGVQNARGLIFTLGSRHKADGRVSLPTGKLFPFPAF